LSRSPRITCGARGHLPPGRQEATQRGTWHSDRVAQPISLLGGEGCFHAPRSRTLRRSRSERPWPLTDHDPHRGDDTAQPRRWARTTGSGRAPRLVGGFAVGNRAEARVAPDSGEGLAAPLAAQGHDDAVGAAPGAAGRIRGSRRAGLGNERRSCSRRRSGGSVRRPRRAGQRSGRRGRGGPSRSGTP